MNKATLGHTQHNTKEGVYSLQKNLHPKCGADVRNDTNRIGEGKEGVGEEGTVRTKSPNRRPTPAKPHHVDHNRLLQEKLTAELHPTVEIDEVPDVEEPDMTLSPAAQAHSLSLFLSSSTSDSGMCI